jgi:uncharacterized membrane protein
MVQIMTAVLVEIGNATYSLPAGTIRTYIDGKLKGSEGQAEKPKPRAPVIGINDQAEKRKAHDHMTDLRTENVINTLKAIRAGIITQGAISEEIGVCRGSVSLILKDLVDRRLVVCDKSVCPYEYSIRKDLVRHA